MRVVFPLVAWLGGSVLCAALYVMGAAVGRRKAWEQGRDAGHRVGYEAGYLAGVVGDPDPGRLGPAVAETVGGPYDEPLDPGAARPVDDLRIEIDVERDHAIDR